jgi:hypothetical protein
VITTASPRKNERSKVETRLWWVLNRPFCLFMDVLMLPAHVILLLTRSGPEFFATRDSFVPRIDGMDFPAGLFSILVWTVLTVLSVPLILIFANPG